MEFWEGIELRRSWVFSGWVLLWLAVAGVISWLLGLGEVLRASIAAGHLLDWVMGGLCLLWLIVLLKAPWDLYFQARAVAFELQRSRERRVALASGREEYVRAVRQRLGLLAVGAHLFSAALVAAITALTGGRVGYYFAGFYLVSTAFRPVVAGYVYLWRKLRAIGEEARYPREDVVEIRARLEQQEDTLRTLTRQWEAWREEWRRESRDLRQHVQALGRHFETVATSLTEDQEVLRGIQALARLVARSTE
jgi:hypothetical protein